MSYEQQINKEENIVYDERNESGYIIKKRENIKAMRNERIKTIFMLFVIYLFTPILILQGLFWQSGQLVFWIYFILIIIGTVVLIRWNKMIIDECKLMIKPLIITDKAIYIPKVKNWEKVYFKDIDRIYWNPNYFHVTITRINIPPTKFAKVKRGDINKIRTILKKYVIVDEKNDMSFYNYEIKALYNIL